MEFFSSKRCIDGKGVTIPSQRRYVEYYADYLHRKQAYKETDLYLKQVDILMPNNSYFNSKFLIFAIFSTDSFFLF
jgi:hypothetical protein